MMYLFHEWKLKVAEGARARGASRIIGVDANASKFEKGTLILFYQCFNCASLFLHNKVDIGKIKPNFPISKSSEANDLRMRMQ